jgi:hypothetical protein
LPPSSIKRLVAPAPKPLAAPVIAATFPSSRLDISIHLSVVLKKFLIYGTIKAEVGVALRMLLLRKSKFQKT